MSDKPVTITFRVRPIYRAINVGFALLLAGFVVSVIYREPIGYITPWLVLGLGLLRASVTDHARSSPQPRWVRDR